MTAPQIAGSNPEAWGLPAPVPANVQVPVHGAPGRDLFYVRSPVTGDVRGVPQAEAQELIFRSGWEPVVEPDAVRLLERQVSRERASPYAAAAYGAARGLSGGLSEFLLPQGQEPGALALQGIREAHPGVALGSEVAGALLPLSRAAGALRYASPVALAEAGGEALTRGVAGEAPGILRAAGARALGMGAEGGVIGSTYEAGQSSIEDTPLTAQKILGGFLAGGLPGALLGAPFGAVEGVTGSLGARFAKRGEALRAEVLTPGISDADLMKIAHREHGVAVPGMIENLQAAIQRDPAITPDLMALLRDKGPIGKQIAGELIDAPALREAAERRAAAGLNAVQELDDRAIEGWIHGKPKKELIREWLESAPAEVDIDAALESARRVPDAEPGARPGERPTRPDVSEDPIMAALRTAQPDSLGRIPLADLRAATSIPREQFDAEMIRLQRDGVLGLVPDDLRNMQGFGAESAERARVNEGALEIAGNPRHYARVRELPELPPAAVERRAAPRSDQANLLAQAVTRAAEADAGLRANLLTNLATTEDRLEGTIARGLAAQDENVTNAVSRAIKSGSPRAQETFSINAYKLVKNDPNLLQWRKRSAELVDALGAEADGLMGLSPGVLGQSRMEARKVRDLFANARSRLVKGDRIEAFSALDELKGRLGPHAKPDAWLGGDDNVARFVRRAYEELRGTLEDANLWGPRAAGAQKEMNALFHRRLARSDGYFKQFFEDAGVPHPRNPWVNARKATPEKIRAALKGIIDPDKSDALSMFRGHVAETRDLASKVKQYYNLSPDAAGRVDELLGGVDNAERGLNEAVTFARREAQAGALFNNRANIVPGYAKWVALGLMGPLGFGAVKVAENIANPGQRIFMRAALERAMRGSESRIANAVVGLTTGKRVPFSGVGATQLAARASASLFHERNPRRRASDYASTLAELSKLSTPEAAAQHARAAIPFVVGALPQAPVYMGLALSRAAQYLLANAPVRPHLTPLGIEVSLPSDSELDVFERRFAGAMDPISAIEDAAQGRGSIEAVQAAEASAPELLEEVRALVIEQVGRGKIPHNRAIDLSIVLGVPLDRTMEPEYINAHQMIHAARFKDSEAQKSRRTFGETGVNQKYTTMSGADRVEADIPPE